MRRLSRARSPRRRNYDLYQTILCRSATKSATRGVCPAEPRVSSGLLCGRRRRPDTTDFAYWRWMAASWNCPILPRCKRTMGRPKISPPTARWRVPVRRHCMISSIGSWSTRFSGGTIAVNGTYLPLQKTGLFSTYCSLSAFRYHGFCLKLKSGR